MEPVVSAVITVLVEELCRSLQNRSSSVLKVEFERMKEKLLVMNAFLVDAQKLRENHRSYITLNTTFAQIRDLVYDADDILLDSQIRSDYEEVFRIRNYTPRGLFFWHNAEKTLMQITMRMSAMETHFRVYANPLIHPYGEVNVRHVSRTRSLKDAVGLEDVTQKIKTLITTEKSCRIAIVGMGGSGKTAIAKKLYNDGDIIDCFDGIIWVTVAQTYRMEDIFANMLKQILDKHPTRWSKTMKADASGPADEVMHQIRAYLTNKNCLIILDYVWRMDYRWWEELINLPQKGNKCESCPRDMGATYIHKVEKLDEYESWQLFCAIAFSPDGSKVSDPEYRKVGKDIVKKCNGLPLAIKTIAMLCTNFFHREENTVLATLRLSYDDLPVELKHCIMCFSVYPEDTEINAKQLVYWWVSEGFVQGNEENTAIDVAYQCLQALVSRCLVESVEHRGYDGRIKKCKMQNAKCKMHDMVRDLIIKISKEEKFGNFGEASQQVPAVDSRHLGYTMRMDLDLLKNNSKLRALLLMKYSSFSFHPALATVNSLRVLDLPNDCLAKGCNKDLLSWVKSQKRLAYLNFEGVDNLKELPDWIKKRQNLRILVMKDCNRLKKLPPSIIYLRKLVLLDVRNCSLAYLPEDFGRLTSLQVFYGFKLTRQGHGTSLGQLKGLSELRVLGIELSRKDEIADGEGSVLRELPRLRVLYIDTKNCEKTDIAVVDKLMPPPALEELHLSSYCGDTTPFWLNPFTLHELLYLSVDHGKIASVSPRFWETGYAEDPKPWKIEGLCFKNLPRFKLDWGMLEIKMKYLRHVEVIRCQSLNTFPINVKNHDFWERR
ncbi:hypothetical protein ACHQM5_007502 [Ranunculus cassubicifolius]